MILLAGLWPLQGLAAEPAANTENAAKPQPPSESEPPVVTLTISGLGDVTLAAETKVNGYQMLVAGKLTLTREPADRLLTAKLTVLANDETLCELQLNSSEIGYSNCPKLFQSTYEKVLLQVEGKEPVVLHIEYDDLGQTEVVVSHDEFAGKRHNVIIEAQLLEAIDADAGFFLRTAKEEEFTAFAGDGKKLPLDLIKVLEAQEDLTEAILLAYRDGKLHRVPLSQRPRPLVPRLDQEQLTRYCEAERDRMMSDAAKAEAQARTGKILVAKDKKAARIRDRARNEAVREKDWGYVVCVDMVSSNPSLIVRTTREGADPAAEAGGTHLFEGRPVWVRVWHREEETAEVTIDGERSRTNFTYIPSTGAVETQGDDGVAPVEQTPTGMAKAPLRAAPVHGLKADQLATLEVKATPKDKNKDPRPVFKHSFDVTAVYRGAIRIGFAGVWAPLDRTYAMRSDGSSNTSQVIVTEAGLDNSIAYLELVTGYSVFFQPIYAGERTMTGGVVFGVGVISGSQNAGIEAFSSLHAGVEWDIGRDFSLAATVSLRRTKILRDGYSVGDAVAADEEFTRFGVTPGFGLLLTWSPDFTKAIGRAGKGL